ncbi:hypothetical protein ZW22_004451 [Salmonella enterica subsp. enterica serovar Oranienburg]|uniref:hypothetical protein n=1 Tax=Enterobacter asburiae TaxID=61645 RepID=UPI00067F02E8|nr:hypothetical protein [Enterobacter asburiae]EDQ2484940.1 hypothetical protein [Salmonella enterica subsp. enterica serovar Oranienburg]EDX0932732.1 hypothetical protein [Salmonella enterica subsp. enterica]MDL1822023.1 hypothetical protein [Yersinia pestis]
MNEQTSANLSADIENVISDVFKETRVKISKDDPVILTALLHERIIETILLKLKENNVLITSDLESKLSSNMEAISAEISNLPNAIDSKTSDLRDAAVALHDEFQQSKGEVKGAFEEARANATAQLSEAVRIASSSAKEVIDHANASIGKITASAEHVINDTLKKPLTNYNDTVDDIAKKLDFSIKHAFNKSTKNLVFKILSIFVISQALQIACWGYFIYLLKS